MTPVFIGLSLICFLSGFAVSWVVSRSQAGAMLYIAEQRIKMLEGYRDQNKSTVQKARAIIKTQKLIRK